MNKPRSWSLPITTAQIFELVHHRELQLKAPGLIVWIRLSAPTGNPAQLEGVVNVTYLPPEDRSGGFGPK